MTQPTSCRLCPHPQLWCSSWGKKHLLSSLQLRGLLLASLTSPQRKGPWVWPVQCLQARTVSPWGSGMGRSLLFPASVRLEGLRPRPLNTLRRDRDEAAGFGPRLGLSAKSKRLRFPAPPRSPSLAGPPRCPFWSPKGREETQEKDERSREGVTSSLPGVGCGRVQRRVGRRQEEERLQKKEKREEEREKERVGGEKPATAEGSARLSA